MNNRDNMDSVGMNSNNGLPEAGDSMTEDITAKQEDTLSQLNTGTNKDSNSILTKSATNDADSMITEATAHPTDITQTECAEEMQTTASDSTLTKQDSESKTKSTEVVSSDSAPTETAGLDCEAALTNDILAHPIEAMTTTTVDEDTKSSIDNMPTTEDEANTTIYSDDTGRQTEVMDEIITESISIVDDNAIVACNVAMIDDTEMPTESEELKKYWEAVKDNPTDFTGWTYLLQYVEQESSIAPVRKAFDVFVARYPYCYGYWKKYADLEVKHGNAVKAQEVFERGVQAVPLSVDLWIHYINYQCARDDGIVKQSQIRALFERAVSAAGMDYRSDKLWEMYVVWERENGNFVNVTAIYDRIIAIPTQLYKHQFDSFCEHVKSHSPKDMLSLDEFLKLRLEMFTNPSPCDTTATPAEDIGDKEEEKPPGTDNNTKGDDEEEEKLREKITQSRRVVHVANEEQVSKRWAFEEAIRRPYFHVKPLENSQLNNWRDYLKFEMSNGTHQCIVVLFERCLIACALYEEFWIKYANYMEPHSKVDVRDIFKRACTIHLPKKVQLHMTWAAFEERHGELLLSLELLTNAEKMLPDVAKVALRRISLERRQGNFASVDAMFKHYINTSKTAELRSFYSIKYARYKAKIFGNRDDAEATLEAALANDETNAKLYLQLVDLEYQRTTVNEAKMLKLLLRAITAPLHIQQRVAFSQRRLDFLEDFGSTIARLLDATEEHDKLLKELQSSKKRRVSETADDSAEKKPKADAYMSNGQPSDQPATSATAVAPSFPCSVPPPTMTQGGAYGDPNATAAAAQQQYNYAQWPGYSNPGAYNYQQSGWGNYGYY